MKLACNAIGFLIFLFSATVCVADVGEDIRLKLDTNNRTIQDLQRVISDMQSDQKKLTVEISDFKSAFRKLKTRIENVEKNAFGPFYNEYNLDPSLDERLNRLEQRFKKK